MNTAKRLYRLDKMKTTMPRNVRQFERPRHIDVLSYVLKANDFLPAPRN
jgi:hypothetical protein